MTFARRVKQQADFPAAIIKSAVGGTTVAWDWNPDTPDKGQKLYPRTLHLIRESLAELDKRGMRYQFEAVMWHQGENDMLDGNLYKQYADGLTKLVARLRADGAGVSGGDEIEGMLFFHQGDESGFKAKRKK